jgi:hypothetical protein
VGSKTALPFLCGSVLHHLIDGARLTHARLRIRVAEKTALSRNPWKWAF